MVALMHCLTLTKRLKKKLHGNYTRMLRAILNKSWRQHPTRHQLYGHLPLITKTIQVRRTRHTGHCWRSKDELISDVLRWTPHMAKQKQDDQLEHTYISYVRIRDVALKCIIYIYIYIYMIAIYIYIYIYMRHDGVSSNNERWQKSSLT